MQPSIFKYILHYSKPQQLFLLVVILGSYPFLYLSLDLPKLIINKAIGGEADGDVYIVSFFGINVSFHMDQIPFLLSLSLIYLLLVLINGGFKYYINVYKGQLGERLLRRLRYQLFGRILRFPLTHFRKISQGELIPMITAEVEPLGGFIGTAFADPLFQGGQLVIILGFILIQDPTLGAAAIAFYPLQMYIIPKLQRKVNALGKQRVQNVRRLSEHIGESVAGIVEVHAHDTSGLELARFTNRLGAIYWIRYEIYRRKFFIKFLNNFIDKLTPFFFFLIGGYLVIIGQLSFGALVAVLAAYKDLAGPWKEMLAWYQQKEDIRIKYDQVIEQFEPHGLFDEEMLLADPPDDKELDGEIVANNVTIAEDDGTRPLDGVSFSMPIRQHTAIVGDGHSGKSQAALLLARLESATSGTLRIDGKDIATLPEAVTGRRITYVGSNAHVAAASVGENLLYGLKHRPTLEKDYDDEGRKQFEAELGEAKVAGNSMYDYNADWVDYDAAGADGPEALQQRVIEVLDAVDFENDVYQMGLRGAIDPVKDPEIAEKILNARLTLRDRLSDPAIAPMVELFDAEQYNTNASVAENLLFGTPLGDTFSLDRIAEHPYVMQVLDKVGLTDQFLQIGKQVAQTMVELFADLPPGHEFFEQFSFISSDELPEFQVILARAARGDETIEEEDRKQIMSLPFKLTPARHRLGLIDDALQQRLLEARRVFAADLPDDLRGTVAFFNADEYNSAATLQDNILFGKLAYGQAQTASTVGTLILEVVESLDLHKTVVAVGLDFQAGIAGARLSTAQRQKLAVARALLKRSDLLIMNEATAPLDSASKAKVLENVLRASEGRGVVWVLNRIQEAQKFHHVVVMREGRIVEQGSYDELMKNGGAFCDLLEAA